MKAVQSRNLHDYITDYCCCNCCSCCFPRHNQCQQQHQQHQQHQQQQSSNQQLSIPPWIPNNCKSTQVPNVDSICSCCSYIPSIDEQQKLQEDTASLTSTGCTTPSDPKVLQEEENISLNMEKLQKKKIHAIEELLQTERDYVQDLSYLVEVCLEVLSHQSWITPSHKSTIIRNAPEILAFHKQFLVFNEASSLVINSTSIAKAFLDQVTQFSLYTHYCDIHTEAWALISEYRDRPEWASFVKDCTILNSYSIPLNLNHTLLSAETSSMQQLTQPKKLYFEDYLIKPVQRICRYQLLIKEIIRYTSSDTAEYDLWKIVLNEMQDIVTDIDERKSEREMKERTDRFIDRLEADWRINKRHVAELGRLLIAGAIEVTYSALGQSVSKPRYLGCFIFSTYIIMVRPKKVTSYEPKHWFPLRMADFEDLSDIEGQMEHSFVIRCKKHTFAFSASCSQEKQLWVKKIQEAILTAKIEASDENLSAQDYIVSSLPGITSKRSHQSIRLSRSFTNILDMTLAGNLNSIGAETDRKEQTLSPPERQLLRRSASTSIQFEDIMKMNMQQPPLPKGPISSNGVTLKKRYSADYSTFANRRSESSFNLKPRNNSETYIMTDSFRSKRRPSSLDLLSAANNPSNMIGKMSLQFKSNHQNALRVAVDHKLRDVCTQEYLASRAWHMRDRDQMGYYQSADTMISSSNTMFNLGGSSSVGSSGNGNDPLKKRKSNSFIRSSASSFSMIIPKRSGESKQPNVRLQQQHHSEYDLQSNTSSSSSSIDRVFTPVGTPFEKDVKISSKRPSQSSHLLRRIPQSRGFIPESPHSFESEYSFTSNTLQQPIGKLERSSSKKQIFVGKVLRRIASLHRKSPSPCSIDSFEELDKVKKAASVDSKRNRIKWRRHEELVQLQVSDRPTMSISNQLQLCNEEALINVAPGYDTTATNRTVTNAVPVKQIDAFAYASTPSPLNVPLSTPRPKKLNDSSKWRNRLSLMKPSSFKIRINSNNNINASNTTTTTTTTNITTTTFTTN